MPIEEAARGLASLSALGIEVGQVIINRVLPSHATGEFYESRRRQEKAYLDEIDARFSHLPRVRVPQLDSDVHGLASLDRIGGFLQC